MHISAKTLDDLLHDVFELLLNSPNRISPSKGDAREEIGVLLELTNPRARLSRTETRGRPFSCLGEFLWYLAYSDDLDFISYYLPYYGEIYKKGQPVDGAYGPRFINMRGQDQVANVVKILRKPDSRRAVIQLFNAEDISQQHDDTPCTCTLQFMNRSGKLHMLTNMRSNDAFLGLPHDVFSFTMLQEVIARTVDVELGTYKHAVGSLHLYETNTEKAEQFLKEGWQETTNPMPEMPLGDPWLSIVRLLEAESEIRGGRGIQIFNLGLDPYWADLVRLLQVFAIPITGDKKEIEKIKSEMYSDVYKLYINQRQVRMVTA